MAGSATYRLVLPARRSAGPQALLLERVGNQATLALDGIELQAFGRPGDPGTDTGKSPRLVPLPTVLESTAELRLEVTMQKMRGGGLSPVLIGPRDAIESIYARQRLRDDVASAGYAASLLLMGGLAAGLWWRQRDALYGCFGLLALAGSLRHIDRVWPSVPIPWPAWGAVLAMAYGCHLALTARFVLLALGRAPRWLMHAVDATLVAVVGLAALAFMLSKPALWTGALALLEVLGIACFAVVLRTAIARKRAIAWFVLAAGTILLLAGLHDLAIVRTGMFGGGRQPIAPHAMFVFVVILAAIVVERYSSAVAQYKALNDSLERRIAERERQLEHAFEALRRQQEKQAVQDERQRIMREIHDGIGSQLVGLLGIVRDPHPDALTLEQHVKVALDEMRMAVDSLQPVHDLTTVLATLRYRLQPRLQAAGIRVVWDVSQLPPLDDLSPQAVLQIQRILLEAFTNVLKHAHATEITVIARWIDGTPGFVLLKLSDNGIGMTAARAGNAVETAGHGLANMQARAQSIGARLQVHDGDAAGTEVILQWPGPQAQRMN